MRPPLKVIATANALVNHDLALQAGDRFRFVGRYPAPTPFSGEMDMRPLVERFPPVACEYPDDAAHRFILKALAKGDLLPCDATTAARASVPFAERARVSRQAKGAE